MSNKSYKTKSSCEFAKEKKVKKSRKEHECCFCHRKLPAGSSYIRTVGVEDNEFFTNAWHTDCLREHQGYVAWNLRRQG